MTQDSRLRTEDSPADLRRLAGGVFADLDRARVTPRQALVFSRLVRATLGQGRQAVRLPRFEVFKRFGLERSHVSAALSGCWVPNAEDAKRRWVPGLVELGMVQVVPWSDGGYLVTVLPDAAQWRCEWRFGREDDAAFIEELNAVTGQVQGELLPAEPGLGEAMAAVSVETALANEIPKDPKTQRPERGAGEQGGKGERGITVPNRERVWGGTESGTGYCVPVTGTLVKQAFKKAGLTGVPVVRSAECGVRNGIVPGGASKRRAMKSRNQSRRRGCRWIWQRLRHRSNSRASRAPRVRRQIFQTTRWNRVFR